MNTITWVMSNITDIMSQQFEDECFERDVEFSARDYIHQTNADVGLVVLKPLRYVYNIYDYATAKYKYADYQKLIMDKVNELDPTCNERYKERALAKLRPSQPQQKEQFSRELTWKFAEYCDKVWNNFDPNKYAHLRDLTTDQLLTEYLNSKPL